MVTGISNSSVNTSLKIYPNPTSGVFKLNPDNSISRIASIEDGKREEAPKELQWTYKKIK